MRDGYYYNLGLMFDGIARRFGERTALRFTDDHEMSYAACNAVSSQLAHWLLAQEVRMGDVVAILNEKHPLAFMAMLACLKIGATYVNLDTTSPAERLEKIVARARPVIVLHGDETAALAAAVAGGVGIANYAAPDFAATVATHSDDLPAETARVPGTVPAYLMFTSGSTGFPKGAVIAHGSVINFIAWAGGAIDCSDADVFTNINPMHFDNSVFDFYASLFRGATMVPVPVALTRSPMAMVKAIEKAGCTIWFSVPSVLVYVLKMRALGANSLPSMRAIVFGGEGFPKASLRKLFGFVGDRIRLVNVYGPTECTCICSSYPVTGADMASDDLLPLGPIAPNFDFLVLDADGEPVDAGEVGELCLRGPNVGLGYYNDPERTAAAFVQVPGLSDYAERCYRTGDLVRYDRAEDLLFFVGRRDNQIKRMGYRIELDEIEVAIGSIDGVRENACVFLVPPGEEVGRIHAFVAGESGLDVAALTAHLGERIPAYMMPNEVHLFDVLPKNQNGKIDRLALKEKVAS